LAHLTACSCDNGCYSCLLNYENQFWHDRIGKKVAIEWLNRFINTGDWELRQNPLSVEVSHDSTFDSVAEDYFAEGLRRIPTGIPGVTTVRQVEDSASQAFEVVSPKLKAPCYIQHTSRAQVQIPGAIPYTKPDFTVVSEGRETAFIYIDGRDIHLDPGEEISRFEHTDIITRPNLRNSKDVPVLTFSYDMVNAWREVTDYPKIKKLDHLETHLLTGLIFNLALPDSPYLGDPSLFKKEMKVLMASFTAHTMASATGVTTEGFLSPSQLTELKAFLFQFVKVFSIGGLTFNPDTSTFSMEILLGVVLDSLGR